MLENTGMSKAESANHLKNHNVILTLIVVALTGCADSLWAGTVLAAYIYIKTNDSNSKVGNVEAANGLATLLTALPVGYIADKYGKDRACALGGVFLLLANGVTSWTIATDESYYFLLGAMFLWGVGSGVVSGPVQALYADSIPAGKRSEFYVYLFGIYLLAGTMGPALSICIFEFDAYGDWTLKELRLVIYAGMCLEFIISILLFFFDDKKALGKEADQVFALPVSAGQRKSDVGRARSSSGGHSKYPRENIDASSSNGTLKQSLLLRPEDEEDLALEEACGAEDESMQEALTPEEERTRRRRTFAIPLLTFVAGLVSALGSVMTVKFFPLFFMNDCEMAPSGVQGIYLAVPIIMALFSTLAQKASATVCGGRNPKFIDSKTDGLLLEDKRYSVDNAPKVPFGRVQTIMVCKAVGVSALFLMVFLTKYKGQWLVMVPIYLFRTVDELHVPSRGKHLNGLRTEGAAFTLEKLRVDSAIRLVRFSSTWRLPCRSI